MLPQTDRPYEYPGQYGVPGSQQMFSTGIEVKRNAAALPQTAQAAIFTIPGRIVLLDIYGLVETQVGAVANGTQLVANPTVGADVDLCADLDINGATVGTVFGITGTLANALQSNASGVLVYQAAPVVLPAGTLELDCAGSDGGGGQVSWILHYLPLDGQVEVIPA